METYRDFLAPEEHGIDLGELRRGDDTDEGECDSCERDLFESSGTPIAPMIVEPV